MGSAGAGCCVLDQGGSGRCGETCLVTGAEARPSRGVRPVSWGLRSRAKGDGVGVGRAGRAKRGGGSWDPPYKGTMRACSEYHARAHPPEALKGEPGSVGPGCGASSKLLPVLGCRDARVRAGRYLFLHALGQQHQDAGLNGQRNVPAQLLQVGAQRHPIHPGEGGGRHRGGGVCGDETDQRPRRPDVWAARPGHMGRPTPAGGPSPRHSIHSHPRAPTSLHPAKLAPSLCRSFWPLAPLPAPRGCSEWGAHLLPPRAAQGRGARPALRRCLPAAAWFSLSSARAVSSELRDLR